jgi:hypothetical protein
MIRRDYILRLIEQCAQMLLKLRELRQVPQANPATSRAALAEVTAQLGLPGVDALRDLSETELIARLISDETSQFVPEKIGLLAAVLREAAETAEAEGKMQEGRELRSKTLRLLLAQPLLQPDNVLADLVPKVDELVSGLEGRLPIDLSAALMRHYERIGAFAKAEDHLFHLLEGSPDADGARRFGIAFYERLLRRSDAELAQGNLPRHEVEAGLREVQLSQ